MKRINPFVLSIKVCFFLVIGFTLLHCSRDLTFQDVIDGKIHLEKSEIEAKKREYLERIKRHRKEKLERDFRNFINLVKDANRWTQAQTIRAFIDSIEPNESNQDYIEWAKEKVDWYDPSICLNDRLLGLFQNQHEELLQQALKQDKEQIKRNQFNIFF